MIAAFHRWCDHKADVDYGHLLAIFSYGIVVGLVIACCIVAAS